MENNITYERYEVLLKDERIYNGLLNKRVML